MTWKPFAKNQWPKEPGLYMVQTKTKKDCTTMQVLAWHGEMRLKVNGLSPWMKVVQWYDHCVPRPMKCDEE